MLPGQIFFNFCFAALTVILAGLIGPVVLLGQSRSYVTHHYTSENGLPQNSINFLTFDRDGFLWMGSESGLIRFDNKEFKVFGLDNITGLKDERIRGLNVDTAGYAIGVNVSSQSLVTNPVTKFSSPVPRIMKRISPYYHSTWGQLSMNGEIDSVWDKVQRTTNLPLIRKFACLENGDIYLIHTTVIDYIKGNYHKVLMTWPEEPLANIPVGKTYLLQCWKSNQIAVWENGKRTGQVHLTGDILNDKDYLNGNFKTFWCPNGSFVYAGNNLYEIYVLDGRLISKLVLNDIAIESPACIYYQPLNNTYYIGSKTNGLYIIKISDFFIPPIPKETGDENFYAIGHLPGDTLVVRNTIIPPSGKSYYKYLHNDYFVITYADTNGILFYDKGFELASYDTKKDVLTTLLPLDEHLISILPFGGDSLLLCTHASVWLVSKKGKVYWHKKLPIGYDQVKAKGLYPLGGDQYLLLTSSGVCWYNLKTNRIEKKILDSISFRSFYLDKAGRVWLGSDGFGGYMYYKGKTYKLPLGPLNAFKSIHAFIDDGKGSFWLTTNNGLYKVRIDQMAEQLMNQKRDLYIYAMDNSDGLPTTEFNGGAYPVYQWLTDGTLVLPSMRGLVEFNPDSLQINLPDKKIFVDEIRVDSSLIQLRKLEEETELSPSFNQLRIKVSCPYFGNSRNLALVYSIQNADREDRWVPVPASGIIQLNQLPPGHYQIIIRKAGFHSEEHVDKITLHFEVLPHFYNTWWFYSLMLLLFAIAGYFISRRNITALKRKNLQIERMVAARTAELRQATKQLEVSEKALQQSNKVKEQIIAMVLHDLRSPIRFLGSISQSMINRFNEQPRQQNLDNLKKLHKSVGLLWSFIEQFFAWAVSQQNAFRVTISEVPIQEVFNNVNQFYNEILIYNGNALTVIATPLTWKTDKDILTLIVRNLLDNANKYTEDGSIWISAATVGHQLQITVKDTGKGLTERQIEHFMNAVNDQYREGNGSLVILHMLKKIGGTLEINTQKGVGSEFIIKLDALQDREDPEEPEDLESAEV